MQNAALYWLRPGMKLDQRIALLDLSLNDDAENRCVREPRLDGAEIESWNLLLTAGSLPH
jgi:hypothetical protein